MRPADRQQGCIFSRCLWSAFALCAGSVGGMVAFRIPFSTSEILPWFVHSSRHFFR
ncbi:MAG: hypothetical protein HQL62_02725 [Magnetococcales bacterium]|nr:hypothetical protein [Magnetococcales bacterium]